jgi:hypothetical protein
MFFFQFHRTTWKDSEIKYKYEEISRLLEQMCSLIFDKRPNCDKILEGKDLWAIDFKIIKNDPIFDSLNSQTERVSFHSNFIRTKSQTYSNHLIEHG